MNACCENEMTVNMAKSSLPRNEFQKSNGFNIVNMKTKDTKFGGNVISRVIL